MSFKSKFASNEGMQQDAAINIASIIDCFTVLITYILAAASFLSLGALDAGIAGTDTSPKTAIVSTVPVASMHIHVNEENHMQMNTSVGGQKAQSNVEMAELSDKITVFKTANVNLKTITISAADKVTYLDLVKLVSLLRKLDLSVVFSGKPE